MKKGKIIRAACKETGWRWVIDTEGGERHYLCGPGAPKGGDVGDTGTLRYVKGASFGNWSWEPDKPVSLDDSTHEELRQSLDQALKLLEATVSGRGCCYAYARFGMQRPEGETCEEYKTWEQGAPTPGCDVCQARKFLARFGIKPWM